jgi:predicted GNAT family acetyltransferase
MTETPPIRQERSDRGGRFVIERAGEIVGELYYRLAGTRAIITHTEVAPQLRELGLGRLLVDAAAQWARSENVKLVPLCSYAGRVLAESPQYADVLA